MREPITADVVEYQPGTYPDGRPYPEEVEAARRQAYDLGFAFWRVTGPPDDPRTVVPVYSARLKSEPT